MKCEKYIFLLDEYLNNELEEKLHRSVSVHLAICENCREEIRFLKLEKGFYQNVETLHEKNFTNQWEAMRNRLVAESLIENEVLPKRKEVENRSQFPFVSAFFIRLENLFLANKTAFGVLLLIAFGFVSIFLLNNKNSSVDNEFNATAEPEKTFKSETDLPKNESSLPDKIIELAETKSDNQPKKNTARKKSRILQKVSNEKRNNFFANNKKAVKAKSQMKSAENNITFDSTFVASRKLDKTTDADFQIKKNDKKLAEYLNKVHLFIVMFRNLENDKTLNAVIGDKYQTEAGMFLGNNRRYKQESLKNKNIPAVELLNEIEPVLAAISNLDNQGGKDNLDNVTVMVKQTGIVFKMRLWMSNVKSAKESSL